MNVKVICGQIGFTLKKYSPEILIGVGITGIVGSSVLACKATLKCEELLDEHDTKMAKVKECMELAEQNKLSYTEEDIKKDILVIKTQTVVNFIKLYGPAFTLMIFSIFCILGAHRIIRKRNIALIAAYKMVEETFNDYRKRVVAELGEAKDAHFRYGTDIVEETETIVDENGKKKKVKKEIEKIGDINFSGFSRIFGKDSPDQHGGWIGSTQWCPVHDYNLMFLDSKCAYFNSQLAIKGFVTINDIYDELGFPRTESGMICGWRYRKDRGNNYISFKPKGIDGNWAFGKDGDSIILDFNIDGVIFDSNIAKSEM